MIVKTITTMRFEKQDLKLFNEWKKEHHYSLRKIGKEIGREEGEKRKAIEIAKSLLDVLDVETIALKTGLSVDEINKLKSIY